MTMSDEEKSRSTALEEWIESKSLVELEDDIRELEDWKLHALEGYVEREEVDELIGAEMKRRNNQGGGQENGDVEVVYGQNVDKDQNRHKKQKKVWNSGLEVISSFGNLAQRLIGARNMEQYAKRELGVPENRVIVPHSIRYTCLAIHEECGGSGGTEWAALFKGEWTEDGFRVKNDYVIPEQEVSSGHIDYEEDMKKYREQGYVVHVHSHPFAGSNTGFSGTDDSHINSHFDVALLFAGKAETLVEGIINVEMEDGVMVQLEPDIMVEGPDLPDVDTGGIEKKRRKRNTRRQNNNNGRGPPYGRRTYHEDVDQSLYQYGVGNVQGDRGGDKQ